MMGMPLPINIIFPKIQEEFKKIIDSGDLEGSNFAIEKDGILVSVGDAGSVLITPEMEYDEIIKLFTALWEVVSNGK